MAFPLHLLLVLAQVNMVANMDVCKETNETIGVVVVHGGVHYFASEEVCGDQCLPKCHSSTDMVCAGQPTFKCVQLREVCKSHNNTSTNGSVLTENSVLPEWYTIDNTTYYPTKEVCLHQHEEHTEYMCLYCQTTNEVTCDGKPTYTCIRQINAYHLAAIILVFGALFSLSVVVPLCCVCWSLTMCCYSRPTPVTVMQGQPQP